MPGAQSQEDMDSLGGNFSKWKNRMVMGVVRAKKKKGGNHIMDKGECKMLRSET